MENQRKWQADELVAAFLNGWGKEKLGAIHLLISIR